MADDVLAVPSLDDRVGAGRGFAASMVANLAVAAVAWVVLVRHYGEGTDSLAYHYGAWLLPVVLALAATSALGLAWVLTPGRRGTGAGLLASVLVAGLLAAAWSLGYFVSLGS